MLQALLITFREGLESFLIVGVLVAYLRKTGRPGLVRGVHAGLAASVLTCTLGAYLWMHIPNQPLYEGIAAIVTAALMGAFLVQMLRTGHRLKGEIEARAERAAGDTSRTHSRRDLVGVALVTTLLVTREGLEAVFFLGVQAFAAQAMPMVVGGAIGLGGAAVLAWLWSRVSHRLHMVAVLRVTAIFLGLFVLQLLVYGVHELAESGAIEGSQAFHDATERFGPEGDIGHALSYSLLSAPLLYLVLARAGSGRGRRATSGHGRPVPMDEGRPVGAPEDRAVSGQLDRESARRAAG